MPVAGTILCTVFTRQWFTVYHYLWKTRVDFLYSFSKGGALQCNKCNFNRATCTKKADFQPVECSLDVAYCMKADGVHEERNGQTGNVTKVAGQSNTYTWEPFVSLCIQSFFNRRCLEGLR